MARVSFREGFGIPAEVELPTVTVIGFTRRNNYMPDFWELCRRSSSLRTVRDLELVVSVAHSGGVDPAESASTVEMRAALVRETARVLKFGNVREVGAHIVIEGA